MTALDSLLMRWVESDALRPLDYALVRLIKAHSTQVSTELLLATALVSEAQRHGHVCLDLKQVLNHPEQQLSGTEPEIGQQLATQVQGWTLASWVTALLHSDAVAHQFSEPLLPQLEIATDLDQRPLVLAGSSSRPRLYLRRYWQYEQDIQAQIKQRLHPPPHLSATELRPLLDQLFPKRVSDPINDQKIACALAARSHFSIITGGPGTGKTTTVVRLLALLQGLQYQRQEAFLTLRLAAPTGKAAARLSEALSASLHQLHLPPDLAAILLPSLPTQVTTLHRLLGSQAHTRHFRHHARSPLQADLVVVDEASMIDIEMLAHLMDALAPHTRLILLGDQDQLASVEAGSILGDLCRSAQGGHYTLDTQAWVKEASGETLPETLVDPNGSRLAQAIAMLRYSHRFARFRGIGALAEVVNRGQARLHEIEQIVTRYLRHDQHITPEKHLALLQLPLQLPLTERMLPLKKLLRTGYRAYLQQMHAQQPHAQASRDEMDAWALALFATQRHFQVLCAVRNGPWGVEAVNMLAIQALQTWLPESTQHWYSGRPVLVTQNDYSLKLMNGDIGLCLAWPDQRFRVAFPDGEGGVRWVLPSRLQAVETVFAMTVHKSQGSEFTHTVLVLPDQSNPLLTKELLYTGITRSSQAFTLVYSHPAPLIQTLNRRISRVSGLASGIELDS